MGAGWYRVAGEDGTLRLWDQQLLGGEPGGVGECSLTLSIPLRSPGDEDGGRFPWQQGAVRGEFWDERTLMLQPQVLNAHRRQAIAGVAVSVDAQWVALRQGKARNNIRVEPRLLKGEAPVARVGRARVGPAGS